MKKIDYYNYSIIDLLRFIIDGTIGIFQLLIWLISRPFYYMLSVGATMNWPEWLK